MIMMYLSVAKEEFYMGNSDLGTLLICELTGLSLGAASVILDYIDVLSTASFVLALTGIGVAATGVIIGERVVIKTLLKKSRRLALNK